MKIPFVGPSYVYRSKNFDTQRAINLYPAKSEVGTSKDNFMLCPTPGRQVYLTLPKQSIRGFYVTSTGRVFAAAYDTLYEVLAGGLYTPRGTISTSFNGTISMADNGLELMVVDGTATGGFILDLGTGVFTQITDVNFEGAVTVGFLGGYFIINRPDTGIYQISALYDGLTWPAGDFANAEGSPDNLVAVIVIHQQVFLIGSNTIQVGYVSGAADFPIDILQGVFIEYGCIAPFTVAKTANTIYWIGNDKDGANVVWRAEGYQPQRISTEPIEYYLSQYDLSEATSYSYQEDGHYFYVINIPGAPTSPVYDITLGQWHERARWNTGLGEYQRDRANFHVYAFDKHLVADYENGIIYEQSLNFTDDNGTRIRRQRIFPYFTDDLEYIYFDFLQMDVQTGVGLTSGDDPDTNPEIMLDWSNDSGNTWSNEWPESCGQVGEYEKRVFWRKLGRARSRIFRATIDSNVPVYWIAAHLKARAGSA